MNQFPSGKFGIFGLCLAAVFLMTILGCGSPSAGEPENFRGLKWGTDVGTLSGYNQIAQEGPLVFYEKHDDQLQIEDVKLEQIIYGFHKGRFYTVMIYLPSTGFNRIKEIMTRQYGQPTQPDNTPSKLIWDGPNVSVLLTSAAGQDAARLAYLYKPIQLEVELKK